MFFRHFSFFRIVNYILIHLSYFLSILMKRPLHFGRPFSMSFEPTTCCNLKCLECPVGQNKLNRTKGMTDFELFKNAIEQTKQFVFYLNLYFQGEPFLHKQLFEMIEYLRKAKIYTCISTNGHFFTEKNIKRLLAVKPDKLIISLDGINQESYSMYRINGDFDKVISGIQQLIKHKKENKQRLPLVEIQFIIFRWNEHEINAAKKLAKQLGVNKLTFKSAQLQYAKNKEKALTTIAKYARYTLKTDKLLIKNSFPNRCYRLWTSTVVTFDGQVVPCCFDKNAKFPMGNLKTEAFKTIWKGKAYNHFRQKILTNRKSISICRNCTEGMLK